MVTVTGFQEGWILRCHHTGAVTFHLNYGEAARSALSHAMHCRTEGGR